MSNNINCFKLKKKLSIVITQVDTSEEGYGERKP